jgi:hypothetical protein
MSEESIQFFANMDGFVSIKKLKKTDDLKIEDIIEYLASIQFTCNNRIGFYLEKLIDFKEINKFVEDNKLYNLDFKEFYDQIYSRKLKSIINKSIPNHIEKQQRKCYIEAIKIYLLDKYMFLKKKNIAYHHIVFPSKKKIMKKKIKK